MDVIFCIDKRVVPGLHVAAWSVLERAGESCLPLRFNLFSDALDEGDRLLLCESLEKTGKAFEVILHWVDIKVFEGMPPFYGSFATYFRLYAANKVEAERFLYLDPDIICDTDISPLLSIDFEGKPAAWVPEAPLSSAVDRSVAEELGNSDSDFYFNAGVILINRHEWRRQRVSEQSMEYIKGNRPSFCDQSALNVILFHNAQMLDERFNSISNMRKHWPAFREGFGAMNRLIHFVDHPKPWDYLGELVHPFHSIWKSAIDETSLSGFRTWVKAPSRRIPSSSKCFKNYRKTIKDKLLFSSYNKGVVKKIKGVG